MYLNDLECYECLCLCPVLKCSLDGSILEEWTIKTMRRRFGWSVYLLGWSPLSGITWFYRSLATLLIDSLCVASPVFMPMFLNRRSSIPARIQTPSTPYKFPPCTDPRSPSTRYIWPRLLSVDLQVAFQRPSPHRWLVIGCNTYIYMHGAWNRLLSDWGLPSSFWRMVRVPRIE